MKIASSSVVMSGASAYTQTQEQKYSTFQTEGTIEIKGITVPPGVNISISAETREAYEKTQSLFAETATKYKTSSGSVENSDDSTKQSGQNDVPLKNAMQMALEHLPNKIQSPNNGITVSSKYELKLKLLEMLLSSLRKSKNEYSFTKSQEAKLERSIDDIKKIFNFSGSSANVNSSSSVFFGKFGDKGQSVNAKSSSKSSARLESVDMSLWQGELISTKGQTGLVSIKPKAANGSTYLSDISVFSSEIHETETMSFSASVQVATATGEHINVEIEMNASREFYEKIDNINITQTLQKLVDPLIVNFDTSVSNAGLSDMKFEFDIDCDGTSDQISMLKQGSGFLALDKNGDGVINDGHELFGTLSGDGFKDLSAYDFDNNGWIDANDEIFDKLRIWTKDETGQDRLFALGEMGIGAIYLGNLDFDYSLKSSINDLNGMIRQTGIFLKDDYTAGTIQHVDFAVGE